LLLDDSAGRIAIELWWTNQEFSLVDIVPPPYIEFFIGMASEFCVGNIVPCKLILQECK
jgi:hypothetical protein